LDDGPAVRCGGCGADLAAVGTWSEVAEWGRTRRKGRWRFALRRSLWFCVVMSVPWAVRLYRGETDPLVYAFDLVWPVAGFVSAWVEWRVAEREYAAAGRRDGAT
jgi:hypothetical protein